MRCTNGPKCKAKHDRILAAAERLQAEQPLGFTGPQLCRAAGIGYSAWFYHRAALADRIVLSGCVGRLRAAILRLADRGPLSLDDQRKARLTIGTEDPRHVKAHNRILNAIDELQKDPANADGVTARQIYELTGMKHNTFFHNARHMMRDGLLQPAGFRTVGHKYFPTAVVSLWKRAT